MKVYLYLERRCVCATLTPLYSSILILVPKERYCHKKYQSPISNHSKIMAKVSCFFCWFFFFTKVGQTPRPRSSGQKIGSYYKEYTCEKLKALSPSIQMLWLMRLKFLRTNRRMDRLKPTCLRISNNRHKKRKLHKTTPKIYDSTEYWLIMCYFCLNIKTFNILHCSSPTESTVV